jgi:hypothetical protein
VHMDFIRFLAHMSSVVTERVHVKKFRPNVD